MNPSCCRPPKYRPVTHVIFDLDGTIVDTETIYEVAMRETVESYGKEYHEEFITRVRGCVEGAAAKIAIETFEIDTSQEDFVGKFRKTAQSRMDNIGLLPGAERMIKHMSANNIPISIGTSSTFDAFKLKTQNCQDLMALFHHVVCGGTDPEVANGKPAPDVFYITADRFVPPAKYEDCLVFEDSQNGMYAAIDAGMQVILIPSSALPYEVWKLATMRLDSFNYFVPELFGLPAFAQEDIAMVFADAKVDMVESMKNDETESQELVNMNYYGIDNN